MKFIKENSYDIVRFFIFQVGITIFSLLLYTAVGVLEDKATQLIVKLLISILSIAFYLALVYTVSWDYGAKDRIRIDSGKISADKYKGAKLAFFANLLNFVLSMLALFFILMYMANFGDIFYSAFGIVTMILRLVASMYIGLLQAVFSFLGESIVLSYLLQTVGFLVLPLLTILIAHIGYSLGDKELKLWGIIIGKYKNKK